MNKLPKIFVNRINKPIRHSQREITIIDEVINEVDLDSVLDNNTYSFNHRYKIILNNNKIIESSIIRKTSNNILTIDGELIKINNIKKISKIK